MVTLKYPTFSYKTNKQSYKISVHEQAFIYGSTRSFAAHSYNANVKLLQTSKIWKKKNLILLQVLFVSV